MSIKFNDLSKSLARNFKFRLNLAYIFDNMKSPLLLCFLFFALGLMAQKVRITEMGQNFSRQTDVEGFDYLHDEMQTSTNEWIANVEISFDTIHPTSIKEFYRKMNEKANKLGANAFQVIASNIASTSEVKSIEMSFYFLKYENRKENKERFLSPSLYLFGFLGHHRNMEGYKIEINEQPIIVPEHSYVLLNPKIGESITIKLGKGLKHDLIRTTIEKEMFPRYYRFNVYKGAFSRSVIDEHEWSFGEFLIRIFTKMNFNYQPKI